MRFLLIVLFSFSLATTASGQFVQNRGEWDDLSQSAKVGYVMGVLDRHLVLLPTDIDDQIANKKRLLSCLHDLGIDNLDLTKLVEEKYTDLDFWDWPPHAIIMNILFGLCQEQ